MNLPLPPEPDDEEEEEEELVALDLFSDVSLEGVASGSDSTAWDPVRIAKEETKLENDKVIDTDLNGDGQPGGVNRGNDGIIDGDVKSSQRKYRQPQ